MFAEVNDVFGRTLKYAHLSQFGTLQSGQRVFQGDKIGVEGYSGHTYECKPHLHLEGITTAPAFEGFPTGGLAYGLYTSTNSWVNAGDAPAQAIRNVYIYLGSLLNPDNSWEFLGWTADLNPVHQGCGSFYQCQLFIHHVPNPELGRWGSVMDFQRHATYLIYENTLKAEDENAIMAGRWDVNSAYWVSLPYYYSWKLGVDGDPDTADDGKIGVPLMNQIGSDPTLCSAQGCTGYQRFSHGYVWEQTGTGMQSAVFCPDVAGVTYESWPDYVIDLPNDILGTILAQDPMGDFTPADPTAPWSNARFDLNGDGVIDLPNDVLGVILHFLMQCFPGGQATPMSFATTALSL